jgi:ClpP class serine protease
MAAKTNQETKDEALKDEQQLKQIILADVMSSIIASLEQADNDDLERKRNDIVQKYFRQAIEGNALSSLYNVVILYDNGQMVRSDADNIYSAVTAFSAKKNIMLILYSTGGSIGPAYLIGKLCREYSDGKFITVIPRHAKSAATLICCATDEIHMGSLSELGPIDPQIDKYPALGLKNSVEHIADLAERYPAAADMFAKYLHSAVNLIDLGYYERVAESAVQYAERLLKTHEANLSKKADQIANDLVYTYKDHGFVIDSTEAQQIFGDKIVKKNTPEYAFGNEIYQTLESIHRIADAWGHTFYFIGSSNSKPFFIKKRRRTN